MYRSRLAEKLRESLAAVVPIVCIVLALSFTAAPMPLSLLLAFLSGGALLVVGMMFFTLGAELAMEPMGEKTGAAATRTKKLWVVLLLGLLLGFMITTSEPDLQVLANQVLSIPNPVLILSVSAGVGIFLAAALLRMLFRIPLRLLLWGFYAAVFILAFFAPESFRTVAFDAGGVTTGPMTVPFIMAFGVGISAIRSDKKAAEDSFGLVALCSVGPILAVLILSLIYHPDSAPYSPYLIPEIGASDELRDLFLSAAPRHMKEMLLALLPITVFFFVFDLIRMRLDRRMLARISVGILYTYAGLVIFLTGVNVGFMPAGSFLGQTLAAQPAKWSVVPLGMLIGWFIVRAEPAVYVLMRQVEELTDGAVSGQALRRSLSVGVAVSAGLSMLRVLTGINLLWFLIPGYAISLLMTFFAPKMFTAIAFDAGGVASGPMTATFLLPFAVGACMSAGGDVVTGAFGVVAMVAMTPLITIQALGAAYAIRTRREKAAGDAPAAAAQDPYEIIEL